MSEVAQALTLGNYRPVAIQRDGLLNLDSVWSLDSETTGMEVNLGHRIITLGIVELFLNKPESEMIGRQIEFKCNPGRPSDNEAIKVHGITDEEAATFPPFSEQAEKFLSVIGDKPIIIYNASFDTKFVKNELAIAGYPPLSNTIIDVLEYARAGLPHRSSARLDDMMRHFNIKIEREIHGALKDALILAHVFRRMSDASKAMTAASADQMHLLKRLQGGPVPIRFDRALKLPTPAEQASHDAFLKGMAPKV